jgi:hypothetical protein
MPRKASNYQNGIQYKIVCKDPAITDCYNGSCVSLKDRKKNHKSKSLNPNCKEYNFKVYRFIRENGGWDNWTLIQLEIFPCNSKQELVARERHWFDILKPTLNTNSPTLDIEKQKKNQAKYYAKYSEEHKDEIAAKQKQYNDEHKDELAAKRKEKIKCVCGCEVTKYYLPTHMKSAKHLSVMA